MTLRMPALRLSAALATLACSSAGTRTAPTPAGDALHRANPPGATPPPQRLEIGRYRARAILACAPNAAPNAPIAIVIPGSGGHGPEEAMPGAITADGTETELLTSFAAGLRAAGFHTLQLGKPGIEFHTTWDMEKIAYDRAMFLGLTWKDLLENASEGIAYVAEQKPCGAKTLVLVGHSEGTMRVADVAARDPRVRGVVFLGFHGHGFRDMVEWQAYRRPLELFVRPDVDADHDGYITRDEAARWPRDFTYSWKDGETRIALDEYAQSLRANAEYTKAIEALARSPLYSNGFWERTPTYDSVAQLRVPILAFTGTLDVMTPPRELEALQAACSSAGKRDCETHLVEGLGHGMSPPKPPRRHALLDQTEGPVDARFLDFFTKTLAVWRAKIR